MINLFKSKKLINKQLIIIVIAIILIAYVYISKKKYTSSPGPAPSPIYSPSVIRNNNDDNDDDDDEEHFTQESVTLYYANWCPHCKTIKPKWEDFKKRVGNSINVRLVEVDELDKEPESVKNRIKGFPTVLRSSNNQSYVGPNAIEKLINELEKNLPVNNNSPQFNGNLTMILCYSNSCPHCNRIIPKWLEFKQSAINQNLPITIQEYESDELPDELIEKVPGFPTVIINNEIIVGADKISNVIDKFQNTSKKLTLFYSKDCSYSVKLLPTWYNFVNQNNSKYNIVNIEQAEMKDNERSKITAFPTLIVEDNGVENAIIGQTDIEIYLENL